MHRKAGGGDADAAHDASDMHIAQADRDASQWSDEALQEELTGVKRVGGADAEETPPPVLMEATAGAVDEQDDATAREEIDATANLGSIAGEADGITASGGLFGNIPPGPGASTFPESVRNPPCLVLCERKTWTSRSQRCDNRPRRLPTAAGNLTTF